MPRVHICHNHSPARSNSPPPLPDCFDRIVRTATSQFDHSRHQASQTKVNDTDHVECARGQLGQASRSSSVSTLQLFHQNCAGRDAPLPQTP